MPALDFPTSPTLGQQYNDWVWNGSQWDFRQTLPGGLPAGSIIQWGGSTAPVNWLLCDGSAVSRTTYSSLFAAVGTSYGIGDGSTTFNLPDLRGRVPVGKNGGSFGTLGATGGAETVALSISEMPAHNHGGLTSTDGSHSHTFGANQNGTLVHATGGGGYNAGFTNQGSGEMLFYRSMDAAGNHTHTISSQGSGTAHNNLQPYQVVNYIIKATAAVTPGESELAPRVSTLEGVRPVSIGGTGATSLTSGSYLKGAGTSAITEQTGIPAGDITSGTLNSARLPAGTVLQVVTKRYAGRPVFTISGDVVISYLSTAITPKSASSLLIASFQISGEVTYNCVYRGYRDGSLITNSGYWGYNEENSAQESGLAVVPYDTDLASTPFTQQVTYFVPSYSTAATTLQISARTTDSGSASFALNRTLNSGGTTAYENLVSNVVIWEIAQ